MSKIIKYSTKRSKSATPAVQKASRTSEISKSKCSDNQTTLITKFLSLESLVYFCVDHHKDLTVFCFECNKFYCLDCVSFSHKSHKIIALSAAENSFRNNIEENLKNLQENNKEIGILIENNSKNLNFLVQRKSSLSENIKYYFKNFRARINEQETFFLNSLETIFGEIYEKIHEYAKNFSFMRNKINEIKQEFSGFKALSHEIPKAYQKIQIITNSVQDIKGKDTFIQKGFEILENFDIDNIKKLSKAQDAFFKECSQFIEETRNKFSTTFKENAKISSVNFHRKHLKIKQAKTINFVSFSAEKTGKWENNTIFSTEIKQLFYESNILKEKKFQEINIENIWPQSIKSASLIYRMSSDEVSSEKFHKKCDGNGPNIVLIYCNEYYVFGYFCPVSFNKSDSYEKNEEFFIFSLANRNGCEGIKFPVKKEKTHVALYQSAASPILGYTKKGMADLFIEYF